MKTAKRRITQIMPHDRPGTLVFKGCFVVAEFLLTSASRSPSASAEPLVHFLPLFNSKTSGPIFTIFLKDVGLELLVDRGVARIFGLGGGQTVPCHAEPDPASTDKFSGVFMGLLKKI